MNSAGIVNVFAEQIRKELDFTAEANNMRRFARNFAGDKSVYVPVVYPELCTRKLITMEYLNGINISDVSRLAAQGYDLQLIAERGAMIGFRATFEFGFFHADPHPGNVFILPDNVIGLVDYGMMAVLSSRDRERLSRLVSFIAMRDDKRVARALLDLSEAEGTVHAEELEPAMAAIIQEYVDLPIREFRLGAMLFEMVRAVLRKGARLRPQLLWLTKSMTLQEDIAHSLQADFNFIEMGKGYADASLSRAVNPLAKPREAYFWLIDFLDTLREFPYNVGTIIQEIRTGRIRAEFKHEGLEPLTRAINRSVNRLSLTVLSASLLIAGSIVTLARVAPVMGGVSLLAILLYAAAGVCILLLVFNVIFRSR
jgi:ubiquinone biosynthesis protein